MHLDNSLIRCLFPYKKTFIEWSHPCLARAFTLRRTIDLLSGINTQGGVEQLYAALKEEKLNAKRKKPKVFHLFYELGYVFQELEEYLKDDEVIGIEIEFAHYRKIKLPELKTKRFSLVPIDQWSQGEYKRRFELGKSYLKNGDCYQYNLTSPFCFEVKNKESLELEDFADPLWNGLSPPGAYASLTDLGPYSPCGRFLLSNSPECLFQVGTLNEGGNRLETMPIKGTLALNEDLEKAWAQLSSSLKDEGELFMIVDLLRNDLSAIGKDFSYIVTKKAPLVVHGLLHQYAKVALVTKERLDLFSVIKAMFPGGSITGAPKKRVMQILKSLENRSRSFYCGSTVLLHKDLQAASLNIRSAVYQESKLVYQAGGGITLLSDVDSEYREMQLKMKSFVELLCNSLI